MVLEIQTTRDSTPGELSLCKESPSRNQSPEAALSFIFSDFPLIKHHRLIQKLCLKHDVRV